MGHGHFPAGRANGHGINKKKLVILGLAAAAAMLFVVLALIVLAAVVVKALSGQSGGIGQGLSALLASLWGAATDFISALWKQVLANPLQFLQGGN
ncbi:MAG: hypothetical protein EOT04_00755 [Candidatus Chaera renei]|uniref:Uncharacterized protein n=2 Tax=Candidatus Saccharimonadaceae TaxID=2171986 RepID=A0A4Q0AJW0_9BACT|nr:MAG: hypothetical protein EOT05_04280 [Candidatus Microsaccharimonas sossegonensis]RWZ79694.1 MAG: hypothetical protein EOT04_00755 [Candidatus Chaera renei]